MTLPLNGPISALDILKEKSLTSNFSINDFSFRDMVKKRTPTATADKTTIKFSDFYAVARAFFNSDFEDKTMYAIPGGTKLSGWTVLERRVLLNGRDTIAGWPTPYDYTYPAQNISNFYNAGNLKDNSPLNPAYPAYFWTNFSTDISPASTGKQSLVLESDCVLGNNYGFGIVRGPVAISDMPAELLANDIVSFSWKAQGGNDAYDVYAYLVNVANGNTITLADDTGSDTTYTSPWRTDSVKILPGQEGQYKFVFISGSYDATGGTVTGARLYIDDLKVNGQSTY